VLLVDDMINAPVIGSYDDIVPSNLCVKSFAIITV
jgi:hypothetical protein